ncbi:MAG: ABC transporter permease subunit [Leptospiraceae bacterium]|nr:ABC transporter permease subunit [Leptospiraceae bacterium]
MKALKILTQSVSVKQSRGLGTIFRFEFYEHIRNRWLPVYALLYLILGNLIAYLGGSNPMQASSSLLSLVLLLTPITALLAASISFNESLPFMELLVSLPVSRLAIYLGKWLGLSCGLAISYLIGMGGTLIWLDADATGLTSIVLMLVLGVMLTFVFTSIAYALTGLARRREIVYGISLGIWFFLFIVYDLLIIGIVLLFGDYPLETPIFILSAANPLDLTRIVMMLHMDLSALMGYTAAVFQHTLGGTGGILLSITLLSLWIIVPLAGGYHLFARRSL